MGTHYDTVTDSSRFPDASRISGVNHVGLAVSNLGAAQQTFEALGFRVTPRSEHRGAGRPGEPVRPLGSANQCLMFPDSYLEILGKASGSTSTEPNRIDTFLAMGPGAHILCFDTPDPRELYRRWCDSGVGSSGAVPLSREVLIDGRYETARFERVLIDRDESPEGLIQAALHLTPHLIYLRSYMDHPNGATMIDEIHVAVSDLSAAQARYATWLAQQPEKIDDERTIFSLEDGSTVVLHRADSVKHHLFGVDTARTDGLLGVGVRTSSVHDVRACATAHGIEYLDEGSRIRVHPRDVMGLVLEFHDADSSPACGGGV